MQRRFSSYSSDDGDPHERALRMRRMMQRMHAPENEVPGIIPLSAVIARGPDLAVMLTHAAVYSTGVALGFLVRRSPSSPDDSLYEQVQGDHRRGVPQLLIGLEYADGRRVTNLAGRQDPFQRADGDDSPLLSPGGGGGGSHSVDLSYWLWPRPTEGGLTIVCAWPSQGIAETRTVISAEAIAGAAVQNVELWPWEPPSEPPEPAAPPLPELPDGWFRDATS
jgi:hypothetical protein